MTTDLMSPFLSFETNGELLTTAADDEFSIVLSGRPINQFEPLGFVAITGKVVSLTLLRHDTNRIFILVTTGESVETGATDIFFYEVHHELLYSGSYVHSDSCRSLREDSIHLMHLHFNSPMSSVCLWPPEVIDSPTPPRLFAADVFQRKIHTFVLPDESLMKQTSCLSPFKSVSLLRDGSRVQLSRVTGVNIMVVSYSDGVIELIEVAGEELSIIKTIAIHERDQVGAIFAEFCGDLSTLISCGHDGLLVRTEIPPHSGSKPVPLPSLSGDHLERSQKQRKELTLMPTYQVKRRLETPILLGTETKVDESRHISTRPLFGRSSTVMTVAEQSLDVTDTNGSDSEALEMTPIVSEPHRPTWTEECEKDAHALEDQVYTEAREKLRGELAEIRKTINIMADENSQLPEIERIGRQEFELDVDEQAAILEETENAVKQVREEIELSDLAKQFTWRILKKRCWDRMEVKGRTLKAFDMQLEVCNFPLCARSQAELARLAAVRNRRRVQMHMEQESTRMMNKSAFGSSVRAIQHEELEEDEEQKADVNRVLAGSIAIDCGGQNELCYSQMELYTREQKIYQIMLIQDNIYRIKENFNKNFSDVYAKKESSINKIRTRLARIRKILVDIQQSSVTKSIIDPAFSPEEQPELLLTVDDSEIAVDLYLSPAELAERETRRLAEEERRRREKLDNWRERGLEEMMGGVLEVRKEDELKKDIPKPAFLLMGKPTAHWTPDDRRLYAEYERKVQELNEEREKYRKFLEGDMKKMTALIDEEKSKFDEQLVVLFNDWIRAQMAVLHEELKVWRLKWMLLVEEEMFVQESDLNNMLKKTEDEETENVDSDTVDHSENIPGSTSYNPYVEKPSNRRHLADNKNMMEDSFRDLDNDPAHEGQPGLDNAVWDRMCKYRRRKVEKELEVKNMALKLADINAFVQHREDELKLIRMRREALTMDLSKLLRDYHYDQTNLELQLLTKQGQVEIEVLEGQLVHDYGDALLISRERVEELNAHIITLGGSKVAHMLKNKEFKKRFYHLEW
ncbi:uncharacterized protein DEA37_0001287 [Paragonimus westermani]|uniref:Cilia- and flagella-associated protein 43 n=1 Tax=Paragonimus westermani TaxID=34504 RepID=A0A5J4NHV4_9TREM|nr:uncharacterized protein DEA37_0001287 [Paragonimus westermani]